MMMMMMMMMMITYLLTVLLTYVHNYRLTYTSCVDIKPDARDCTLGTPGICHVNATCNPVTPYLCYSTGATIHRCECNQGFSGDGIDCTGMSIYR